jgi:hypothetical protein
MPKVQLTITLSEQGELSVTGPIHDKLTCYALLEAGKDEVRKHYDALQAKTGLVEPSIAEKSRFSLTG